MLVRDSIHPLTESILDLDSVVQQHVRNNWPETWLQINLPLGSTRALLAIQDRDARTPGRVSEILGVSRTTVTGLLDRLETAGLITRSIDPDDRRSLRLELTSKGRTLVAQIEGYRRDLLGRALAHMDTDTLAALQRGLAGLAQILTELEATAASSTTSLAQGRKG